MKAPLDAGRPVTLERIQTMADGLAASRPGDICFEIARQCIDEMVLVEEVEMLRAMENPSAAHAHEHHEHHDHSEHHH